ncbi:putative G-protein coupled receptor [Apostichopus japonicus]|uniref:Putative G-protein coupled receptor n=1 Tax=Stichopus japonicus TaxID=307972 RepID=A0A2G8LQC7_STIJA|nr:putative G-protein coupled receptor [Apostichopus japonicus]
MYLGRILLLSLPMLLFKKEFYHPQFNVTICIIDWPITQLKTVYNLGTFFATYAIPLTIIGICYAILLRKLWKYSISDRETGNGGEARARMMQRKRHVTFMILIVVLGFAICWLPIHSFQIWSLIVRPPPTVVYYYVRLCSLCLAYTNSAVNPIVYAFVGGKFRERFFYACPFFCRYSIVRQETMPLDHVVKDKTTDTGYDTKRTKIVNSSENTDPKD